MIYFTFDPRPDLKKDLEQFMPEEQIIYETKVDNNHLNEAEILVTYGEDLTPEHMKSMKNLKWIFVASAGIEKMPLAELDETEIIVSNVRGIHKKPMAESVLAHILSYYRSLPAIYAEQRAHNWKRKMPSKELNGATALILGPGAIGSEMGRLLQAFGVNTIGCNRSGKQADYMDEMIAFNQLLDTLPRAEIVLSVLPSTKETKYLLTANHFKAMNPDTLFLNFGRGDLVATNVLIEALQQKEIAYAVCDVFEQEPLPSDSPLYDLENLTVSPHVSSQSSRYLERSFDIFKENYRHYRKGDYDQITNQVNLKNGY